MTSSFCCILLSNNKTCSEGSLILDISSQSSLHIYSPNSSIQDWGRGLVTLTVYSRAESTKLVNLPRNRIGHIETFLTFRTVHIIKLEWNHLKFCQIDFWLINCLAFHVLWTKKIHIQSNNWSNLTIFLKPSSFSKTFLRILDPEILTFCGLWILDIWTLI